MSARFLDKVAIVTGGAAGIGAAASARFAAEGAQVVVADRNTPAELPDGAVFHQTDVGVGAEVKAMVAAVEARFGRIDVLVNNAGVGSLAETPDLAEEEWERVFAVNVSSIYHACRAAVPVMARSGGAIVNIASISGLFGDYGFSAYNASKGAVINYTRSLALDCARDNIRVNALCPGFIATALTAGAGGGSAADRAAWLDPIPLGRQGRPEEMANVIAFLASDEASYMTGAIVTADGGITAHSGQPNVVAQVRRRRQAAQG